MQFPIKWSYAGIDLYRKKTRMERVDSFKVVLINGVSLFFCCGVGIPDFSVDAEYFRGAYRSAVMITEGKEKTQSKKGVHSAAMEIV